MGMVLGHVTSAIGINFSYPITGKKKVNLDLWNLFIAF